MMSIDMEQRRRYGAVRVPVAFAIAAASSSRFHGFAKHPKPGRASDSQKNQVW